MNNPKHHLNVNKIIRIIGKKDLESFKESIDFHNLSSESKLFFTSDQKTIHIARNILGPNYINFQIDKISNKTSKVLFKNIKNTPYFKNYQKNNHLQIMLAAGGPAAEEQIIIAATDKNIRKKFDKIIYLTRNYLESNSHHSTKQIHSRNSSAIYSNNYFAGHRLLINSLLKYFFPKKYDILDVNYPKIDVKLTCDIKILKIYFQNELNWLWQRIRKFLGKETSYDLDLQYAKKSIEIQKKIEKENKINLRNDQLPAMEIILKGQKNQKISDISHVKLEENKIKKIFEKENLIKEIILFNDDGCLRHDIHQINAKIAKKNSAKWLESVEISQVLIDKKNNKLAGIVTQDGEYIYCSKLHLSLGYKAKYQFSKDLNFNIKISDNIIATGLSMVAIFKNSQKLKNILNLSSAILVNDIYISFIAKDDDYVLLKIAAVANIGSNKYNNSYFFNILHHLRLIFSDDLLGILSCYACSRSINNRNSTKFTKITEDIIISDGKGGSGNSKRYFEGDFALEKLCYIPS